MFLQYGPVVCTMELRLCYRNSPLSLLWQNGFVLPVEEATALPVAMQGTGKEPPWLPVGIVTLKHQRRAYEYSIEDMISVHFNLYIQLLTMGAIWRVYSL